MRPEEIGYAIPASSERRGLLSGMVKMNRYLMLLLIVPAAAIYFWPPYKDLEHARQRLSELELQRDTYKVKAERLERKLELIKTDPGYLEAMARDRLHLQKDGEKVFRFED
jgi:cell division protein FtsB